MNTRNGRQRGRRSVPATPELIQELVDELEMLYLEYRQAGGAELREARRVEVVDAEARPSERWYQRLLSLFVPVWLPASKEIVCWWLPEVLMEDGRTYVHLYLSVETGEPYITVSPQPVADHFIPDRLPVTLSANDLKELIVRVESDRIQVLALIIINEH